MTHRFDLLFLFALVLFLGCNPPAGTPQVFSLAALVADLPANGFSSSRIGSKE